MDYRFPEMVRVPPGRLSQFQRVYAGTREPVGFHYAMEVGKHPVTWQEWDAAIADGAGLPPFDDVSARGARAVFGISYAESTRYIDFLNRKLDLNGKPERYRLPKPLEWDYVALAGAATRWFFGDNEADAAAYVTERRDELVTARPANPWGLYQALNDQWCAPPHIVASEAPIEVEMRCIRGFSADKTNRNYQHRETSRAGFRLFRTARPGIAELAAYPQRQTGVRHCPYDAFLSHNQRDGSLDIKAKLEARGLRIWHDNDADMSDLKVQEVVTEALATSRCVCLCVGPEFRFSEWVRAEINAAPAEILVLEMRGGGPVPNELAARPRFRDDNLDELESFLRAQNSIADVGGDIWKIGEDELSAMRAKAAPGRFKPGKLIISGTENSKLEVAFGDHSYARYEAAIASGDEAVIERCWQELFTSRGRHASTVALRRYTEALAANANADVLRKRWNEAWTFSTHALMNDQTRYSAEYEPINLSDLAPARYRQLQATGAPTAELDDLWRQIESLGGFEMFKIGFERGLSAWDIQGKVGLDPWFIGALIAREPAGSALEESLIAFEMLVADAPARFPAYGGVLPEHMVLGLAQLLTLPQFRARAAPLVEPLLAASLTKMRPRPRELTEAIVRAARDGHADAAAIQRAIEAIDLANKDEHRRDLEAIEARREAHWRKLMPPPRPWWRFW